MARSDRPPLASHLRDRFGLNKHHRTPIPAAACPGSRQHETLMSRGVVPMSKLHSPAWVNVNLDAWCGIDPARQRIDGPVEADDDLRQVSRCDPAVRVMRDRGRQAR
jgi:hypothetical protein